MIRRILPLFTVAVAALALAGCASGSPAPASSGTSTPAPTQELDFDAAWLDGGRMIGIVTEGSSSLDCIPTVGDVSYAGGVLDVEFVDAADDTVCTTDYVPRVTLVAVPAEVDPTQDLEIRVTGEGYAGDEDLDGVPGLAAGGETDYLPTAGWAGDDDEFVILSWGSSTCPPVIESVEATSTTEATVTFVTPEDDQACTMDMAPRGVVAQVDGLDDDVETFAILQGAEFDNIRIPIVGG